MLEIYNGWEIYDETAGYTAYSPYDDEISAFAVTLTELYDLVDQWEAELS